MRARPDIKPLSGRVFDRPEMIEENERPDHFATVKGQDATHNKAVAKIFFSRFYDLLDQRSHA